ncbi:glycogen synthase GlgA [Frigidibacter sp. RF13]|uniref:glycogen synthase GlgA n=1 Tax=Frigidibacter sp. RF13 TaxID=2997340 RepID=UPI00226D4D7A|nr:glycogen synthase GlgA [Frigidibacter sp. RF13]MCY1125633.1 glycogen synthase GlgA [Frigidibacter sp. RF13]
MSAQKREGSVLSVASECVPLVKTGGLADVVGALPGALAPEGWEVRTLLPSYRGLVERLDGARDVWAAPDLFGGPARIVAGSVGSAEFYLLDAPHLFDRTGGPYSVAGSDHPDNPERFAALSWAAASIAAKGDADGWRPDVLHAHDWQAGLAPAYLSWAFPGTGVGTILTIHNIAFQGIAPAAKLMRLRLPSTQFHPGALEYWGNISSLKAGLITADRVTTVSPTYAEELRRPAFGMGLEGVIADRGTSLSGILNGIDTTAWNPATDSAVTPYSATSMAGKAENRKLLAAEFGLGPDSGPLAIVVSRLSHQKGMDILVDALPGFVAGGGTLALLGSGDSDLEAALSTLAARFPGKVGVRIGYDEDLSHRMFAGGDAVIVPSRFEPCGLTQLYGLRYGTIPVVALTGGLADTVIGATPASLGAAAATGITFHPVDRLALTRALDQLLHLYADKPVWKALQKRAMKADFGWGRAARAYADLYASVAAE